MLQLFSNSTVSLHLWICWRRCSPDLPAWFLTKNIVSSSRTIPFTIRDTLKNTSKMQVPANSAWLVSRHPLPCPSKKNVNLWLDRSRRPGGVGSCALNPFSGSTARVWDCLETFWKRFLFENKWTRWKTVVSKKGTSDFFLHRHAWAKKVTFSVSRFPH